MLQPGIYNFDSLFDAELPHGFGDLIDLVVSHFREHRQGQATFGDRLADRQITLLVAEMGISFLEMDRQRIVQGRLHPAHRQVFLQVVAARMLDDKQIPVAVAPLLDFRQHQARQSGQRKFVVFGNQMALRRPSR